MIKKIVGSESVSDMIQKNSSKFCLNKCELSICNYLIIRTSPSIVTYFPGGRLGNMLTAFLTLLWVHWETGLDVYFEKESHDFMNTFFENIDYIPTLEDSFCDWRQFPFKKYEVNL